MRKSKGYKKLIFIIFTVTAILFILNKVYQKDKQLVYYPSGEIKQEYYLKNGEIDGRVTEFYKSGRISSLVQFKEGKQHGWAQFFFEDGQLRKKTFFKEGV
jgi:antitoxin component YwqK of YwqJK toxin-antitoxin module